MQDLPSTQPISTTPLSHEALAGLQKLFATAAEQWTESLSATLGHPVFISLDNSGLRTFRQAAYSLAPPLNLMRLRNRQDHQGWWVSLDTTAVSSMLDLMFGAPNNVWKPLERPLCSIEVELLQPVVDEFLQVLSDTWRPVCPVDLSLWQWFHDLTEIESELHDSLDQSMVHCKWEMTINQRTAWIHISLPTSFVLAWEKRLMQYHYDELEIIPADQVRATIALDLKDQDGKPLQVGDVLATDYLVEQPLSLATDQGHCVAVHLGAVDGLKAFEVADQE